ncbi:MAG: tryptophan--tRNA ligase [Micromonosporaceae bacterium]
MPTQLTGFKPTGPLHLGNYLGAVKPLVRRQRAADTVTMIVDLHALTVDHDPAALRARTTEIATLLLAAGTTSPVVQSQVPEHTGLHYLLEATASYGEAHRMIQFKEKGGTSSRLALLTYPVLMAADILLYDTEEVPVGEDQRQHVELTRDLAIRFNRRYGETFTVPRAVNPPVAARVMDLADPTRKMEKSNPSPAGVLYLLDPPETLRRKIARAVTDTGADVRYDPDRKPGVSNLLEILAACQGGDPRSAAVEFASYQQLKAATADAVIGVLRPLQQRYAELAAHPDHVAAQLRAGAKRAREHASETLRRATHAIGLL